MADAHFRALSLYKLRRIKIIRLSGKECKQKIGVRKPALSIYGFAGLFFVKKCSSINNKMFIDNYKYRMPHTNKKMIVFDNK